MNKKLILIISAAVAASLIIGVIFAVSEQKRRENEFLEAYLAENASGKNKDADEDADKNEKVEKEKDADKKTDLPDAPAGSQSESDPETVPAPVDDKPMNQEEMYHHISGNFANIEYCDGSTFGWFEPFTGNPDDPFYGYGDVPCMYAYRNILGYREGKVILPNDEAFWLRTPWMLTYQYSANGIQFCDSYCFGTMETIERDMQFEGSPQYVIEDSDKIDLSEECIYAFGDLARLAKNEIYARHGRKFKDEALQNFFNNRPWYNGTVEPDQFDESVLSDIERKNVEFLKECENI